MLTKLTREQAALIGAFTGVACGPFSDIHEKVEAALGRPVFTHEMASPELWDEVRDKLRAEFLSICFAE